MRVSIKRIEAARMRARARNVREADRRVWWLSTVDRDRRRRLADLMDAAADKLERAAAEEDEAAELWARKAGVCL